MTLIRAGSTHADFVAFVPLSNWLVGFERYGFRWTKARIEGSRHPDAFYMLREDEPWTPGLAKTRRLIAKLGRAHDRVVALRARLPVGPAGMLPNTVTGTGIGWRWPAPEIPLHGVAWVDDGDALVPTRHEEISAAAFRLEGRWLRAWSECRPRSMSVLPIAKACQASCGFCFSKASVSTLVRPASAMLERWLRWASLARTRGAERAVVTGGGEPTLLPRADLLALVAGLAERFPSTLLITNGARLDAEWLRELRAAGLTTLAISRHGGGPAEDAALMGLAVDSRRLAQQAAALGLRTRAICVLQRGGIADEPGVRRYLERAVDDGFDEVCFKELYVSSLAENPWAESRANRFCEAHQVPLQRVIAALHSLGFEQADTLPWGSPVFAGELAGRRLRVAAYTEPSVGWERTQGLVRSWNALADGSCVASLEDPSSVLHEGGEGSEGR